MRVLLWERSDDISSAGNVSMDGVEYRARIVY